MRFLFPKFVIAIPVSAGRGNPARGSVRSALRWLTFLVVPLLLAAAARAQSVHWEVADDPGEIVLSFENCAPDGDPQLPAVDGVQFAYGGTSESSQISFGTGGNSSRRTISLHYRLRARAGAFTIPAFEVKSDKGPMRVAAFSGGGNRSSGLDNAATSRLMPANATVWAGEVFPITYTLDVIRRNFSQLSPTIDWTPTPLITEEWTKPEATEMVVNGEPRFNIAYKSRALAKTPGLLTIGNATQLVNLQTGSIGFGIFQTPRVEQVSVESNRPRLTVKALPAPAPANFSGAVGEFKLVSKVVPETAAVGEPVTWTIELSGTGNWPDIAGLPSREVSNDFQVVQPKAKRTPAEGKLFDVTLAEDVVLVPTKTGAYPLGPIAFSYFDPKSGAYKTITAARTTLNITAPNAPKLFNPVPAGGTTEATASATEPAKPSAPPATPAAPAGIPRDPLPGSDTTRTPMDAQALLIGLLSPVAGLLFFWLWLAVRRAQRTDPARARREARVRLSATLAQLRTAPSSHLLLSWQHDAAILWQIAHAAPPATAFSDAAWTQLWLEADRSLYGVRADLPPDWVARAEAALAAKRVPGFNPLRLFLPRNLLPFAALLFIALVPVAILRAAETLKAADPIAAYRGGDFAGAEKSWRTAIASAPTDWIARHNLSLALAQQDRAGEAAAQAAAAFVQNPADPSVRWHFALAAEKAGFAPAPLAGFIASSPTAALARLASPATWQLALIGAAVVAALALGWMLANSYGRRSRAVSWAASAVFVLSVLFAATALVGLHEFGESADARAVLVWRAGTLRSIPTEADTAQKSTSLAAGSVAIVDKTFLGWARLAFENGQTGWVRKEEFVPFWK
jgi:hypothetical protein